MNKKMLSQEAQQKILTYAFPGNVRELKSVIDLACVMCENHEILDADLTFSSINNMDFFLSEKKTLKEFTHEIIMHYLKKNNIFVLVSAILKSTLK